MAYKIDRNAAVLVIGDLMLDHYIYGNCNRLSPEAPVQVVEVKNDEYTLGGAGNVLKNLEAFGCTTKIISVIGDDDSANIIYAQLKKFGFDSKNVIRDNDRCTTLKSRVLVSNHQLIRIDREDTHPIDENIAKQIIDLFKIEIQNFDVVLISDYNKGLLSDYLLKGIFSICKEANVKTIVDPKGNDYDKYKGANIIKPNKKEAVEASGIIIIDKESLANACKKIKEITDCNEIIVTMSEDGIAMYSNNELTTIPTKALSIIDVTGAGDTVLASLGMAIAKKQTLYQACDFANHAAAIVVSKVGSATATLSEISSHFS